MFKFTRILEWGKGRIWGFSAALFSSPVLPHSAAGDCFKSEGVNIDRIEGTRKGGRSGKRGRRGNWENSSGFGPRRNRF